ncbi:MAG TPA: protein adenylyltransferase SelO family protein, partial [Kofleriaceae bacterium]
PEPLQRLIQEFPKRFSQLHRHSMLRKLGLTGRADTHSDDEELLGDFATLLVAHPTDMTIAFRALADGQLSDAFYGEPPPALIERWDRWRGQYARRIRIEDISDAERVTRMHAVNPIYVPRNYVVQEVIDATEKGDRTELGKLLDVLRDPYTQRPGLERYAGKRPAWAENKPGCSMLSCSS